MKPIALPQIATFALLTLGTNLSAAGEDWHPVRSRVPAHYMVPIPDTAVRSYQRTGYRPLDERRWAHYSNPLMRHRLPPTVSCSYLQQPAVFEFPSVRWLRFGR